MDNSGGKYFYSYSREHDRCMQRHICDIAGTEEKNSMLHLFSCGEIQFTPESVWQKTDKLCYYLWFVVEGNFNFVRNRESFDLLPGDVVLTRPGDVLNSFRLKNGRKGTAKFMRISSGFHAAAFAENPPFTQKNVFHPDNYSKLLEAFAGIEVIAMEGTSKNADVPEVRRQLSCRLYEMFTLLIKGLATDAGTDKMSEIIDYMMRNIGGRLTLRDIEQRFHIERHTLSRMCIARRGTAPMRMLRLFRLEYSSRLLKSTAQRVEDIAVTCGFPDGAGYSRIFRKYYGISPLAYRKKFVEKRTLHQYSYHETKTKMTKTERQELIFQQVNVHPHISRAELARITKLSMSGVDWNIRRLKEKGLLNRFGAPRKGRWHPITEFRM